MAAEVKGQEALCLLQEAGRLDFVREEVVGVLRPARRAASGVAAAFLACWPPRCVPGGIKMVSMRQRGRVLVKALKILTTIYDCPVIGDTQEYLRRHRSRGQTTLTKTEARAQSLQP
ncbi:hypothetical protein NDU88_001867 [Pleurodeles waltl]|uniref:Uncharacterized protein n=1 Tax=Pleurodeles waltl TaxID=8319 RepID=A0AAV7UBM4_PLEWA|nr:hypothetical protein NDU88_001867 [Pleurodeles waltl]